MGQVSLPRLYHSDPRTSITSLSIAMKLTSEQVRLLVMHEWRLHREPSAACANICLAWGEKTTSRVTVRRWFTHFESGDMSLASKPRSGRPRTHNAATIVERFNQQPTVSNAELANELQCSATTIRNVLRRAGERARVTI